MSTGLRGSYGSWIGLGEAEGWVDGPPDMGNPVSKGKRQDVQACSETGQQAEDLPEFQIWGQNVALGREKAGETGAGCTRPCCSPPRWLQDFMCTACPIIPGDLGLSGPERITILEPKHR